MTFWLVLAANARLGVEIQKKMRLETAILQKFLSLDLSDKGSSDGFCDHFSDHRWLMWALVPCKIVKARR